MLYTVSSEFFGEAVIVKRVKLDKMGPEVPWPNASSYDEDYDRYWIERLVKDGGSLEDICWLLDIHPKEVIRLGYR